jgi:hypothetical protein
MSGHAKAPLPACVFNAPIAPLFHLAEACQKAELSMNDMGGSTNMRMGGGHIYSDEDIEVG